MFELGKTYGGNFRSGWQSGTGDSLPVPSPHGTGGGTGETTPGTAPAAPPPPAPRPPSYKPPPQYAVGTDYVPQTGLAVLHQGEMVIPRDEAGQFRSGDSGGNTYIVNVQGLVKAENPEEILRTLQRLGYLLVGTQRS